MHFDLLLLSVSKQQRRACIWLYVLILWMSLKQPEAHRILRIQTYLVLVCILLFHLRVPQKLKFKNKILNCLNRLN